MDHQLTSPTSIFNFAKPQTWEERKKERKGGEKKNRNN